MDVDTSAKIIANRIKELRKNNNETQCDLAIALNCNQNNISKIERGMCLTSSNLIAIANHYGVSMDYLCGEECGRDVLETLTQNIRVSCSHFQTSVNDHIKQEIPILEISRPLYDYLLQIAMANGNDMIPVPVKEHWVQLETQNFRKQIQENKNLDYKVFVPMENATEEKIGTFDIEMVKIKEKKDH